MKLLFVLSFFIALHVTASPVELITSQEGLENYLNECHFNGVLLVGQGQKEIFKKAFGVKDFESKRLLNTDDKFQIGSVTKQFVAASLLKLQQEGKLSLDDDAAKYLPAYTFLKGLKIRSILNHTAGIANYTEQASFWQLAKDGRAISLDDILNFTALLPFDFAQGSAWNYSNSDYIVAGKLVDVISGKSWNDYINTSFLKPLHMTNTGYANKFETVSDVVGYIDNQPAPKFDLSWALSAGALYSTVDDLFKWTAIYNDSSILTEESKLQMQTPFLKNYALGLLVDSYNNEIRITHGGRTPGFKTTVTYLKKSKLTAIKLDNTDGGTVDAAQIGLEFFAKGSTLALKLKEFKIPPETLNDFEGIYAGQKINFKVFVKDNSLYLQPDDGQPPYLLVANDTDSFRLLSIAGEEFIRDEKTKAVTGLKHYQDGHVSDFKKIKP